jgi:hypothetical protein
MSLKREGQFIQEETLPCIYLCLLRSIAQLPSDTLRRDYVTELCPTSSAYRKYGLSMVLDLVIQGPEFFLYLAGIH